MITLEEKIKLAEEIGMDVWASQNSVELEMQKQANELTRLKIKPTSREKIREQICPEAYFSIWASEKHSMTKPAWWRRYCLFGPTWIKGLMPLESMRLEEWKDNIPYGGLLAVKEAKAMGLTDFQIHFPVTPKRERLKLDPVITGVMGRKEKRTWYSNSSICPVMHNDTVSRHSHMRQIVSGQLMEVFAWDDGKIYE